MFTPVTYLGSHEDVCGYALRVNHATNCYKVSLSPLIPLMMKRAPKTYENRNLWRFWEKYVVVLCLDANIVQAGQSSTIRSHMSLVKSAIELGQHGST